MIDELTLLAPYSRIEHLTDKGEFKYSELYSQAAETAIIVALDSLKLPITRIASVVGRSNQEQLDAEYEHLAEIHPRDLPAEHIGPALQAYLSMYATRYVLMVYSEGFFWDKSNMGDIFLNRSDLYLAVADTRTGKIIYFNRSLPEDGNPLNVNQVYRRIKRLINDLKVGSEGQIQ